jgi:hypothetical protein
MPNLTGEIKQYRLVCNQACFSACTAALLYTTLKPTSLWLTIFAEKEGVKIWRNIFDEEQELSLKIELDDHFITARLKDFRIISSSHIQKYVEKKSSYMTSVDLEGSR